MRELEIESIKWIESSGNKVADKIAVELAAKNRNGYDEAHRGARRD